MTFTPASALENGRNMAKNVLNHLLFALHQRMEAETPALLQERIQASGLPPYTISKALNGGIQRPDKDEALAALLGIFDAEPAIKNFMERIAKRVRTDPPFEDDEESRIMRNSMFQDLLTPQRTASEIKNAFRALLHSRKIEAILTNLHEAKEWLERFKGSQVVVPVSALLAYREKEKWQTPSALVTPAFWGSTLRINVVVSFPEVQEHWSEETRRLFIEPEQQLNTVVLVDGILCCFPDPIVGCRFSADPKIVKVVHNAIGEFSMTGSHVAVAPKDIDLILEPLETLAGSWGAVQKKLKKRNKRGFFSE